jgi:hypothetical protein
MKSVKVAKQASKPLTSPVLILVEGSDEKFFIEAMCAHWFPEKINDITIENVEGSNNFSTHFEALTIRSSKSLRAIGIITDSEENPDATKQRWNDLFVKFPQKCVCKKLQLPSDDQAGAFETLALTAVSNNPIVKCATDFRDCVVEKIGKRTLAQKDKIVVQAWLSAELGNAYANLFKAQEKNPDKKLLDYDHPAFTSIKTFIADLLTHKE